MRHEDSSEDNDSMPFAFTKPSEIIAGMACRDLLPRQTRRVSRIIVFR